MLDESLNFLGVDNEFGQIERLTGTGGGSMSRACGSGPLPDDGCCCSDAGRG